jgi:hypothetical protein
MKKILLLSLFMGIFFLGCSRDETTVQILRTPLLSFNFNGSSTWKADNYSFAPVSKVVVYPADTSQTGQLFNRYTLQGTGNDSAGNSYQLIITFDNADPNLLTGIYKPHYTNQTGLAQVQLFNLTNSNNLAAYNLCSNDTANAILQIQKQKPDERLITGSFQMMLCNSRDSSKKINITNGIIKDIKY